MADPIPREIDSQAVELFRQAGWTWTGSVKGFIQGRQEGQSLEDYNDSLPRSIGYGELRDHYLAGPDLVNRDKGLIWLRRELGLIE